MGTTPSAGCGVNVAQIRVLGVVVLDSPGGVHEAEWERSVYALVCGSARIARRRSVTHVYKETRVHTDTYTRIRRDEPLPLVLVDQYTMLVEARWEEEAGGRAHGRMGKREEALLKSWTHWTYICTMRSPESRVAVFGISSPDPPCPPNRHRN